jgi:hypothetical protein
MAAGVSDAIWIEREGEWPLPTPWHGRSAQNLLEAAMMVVEAH